MTQIINRRTLTAKLLGTLADGASTNLDSIYGILLHKAFLFEYMAQGTISCNNTGEFFTADGVSIILVQAGLSAADIETILAGAQITDVTQSTEVPSRQRMFALAEIQFNAFNVDAAGAGNFHWRIHFKPRSKGGIPFTEGSGWELKFINRTGGALTTGSNVSTRSIYERFAYEGGGGA